MPSKNPYVEVLIPSTSVFGLIWKLGLCRWNSLNQHKVMLEQDRPQPNTTGARDQSLSSIRLFETPWTVAHQGPLSVGFSRQEYWSGLSFPSPGDLPHPGIEPTSLMSPALAGSFFTTEPPGKPNPI